MTYSVIGLLAILIHLIINRDLLRSNDENAAVPAYREYRNFIMGLLVFFVIDVSWGFLNEYRLTVALYIVTFFFFISMTVSFWLWSRYVVAYLNDSSVFTKILSVSGVVLCAIELVFLTVNFFVPIQFYFDRNGNYHAGIARNVTLLLQVILFAMTFAYTFHSKSGSPHARSRLRRTVGLFGITMALLIILQLFYPMLPLYSMGYLLCSCLLHTFVAEDEKQEYYATLEKLLLREEEQNKELGSAKRKIYTDPLTGVKNKQAYMDEVEALELRIQNGMTEPLGLAVFDLNDLKTVNDTQGHDMGDIYIYNASMLISEFFCHSCVYRVGGDEFTVILQGEDFANYESLLAAFDRQVEDNLRSGKVVVSSGVAEFLPGKDVSFRSVFERADKQMYLRKHALKALKK